MDGYLSPYGGVSFTLDAQNENVVHFQVNPYSTNREERSDESDVTEQQRKYNKQRNPLDEYELKVLRLFPAWLMDIGRIRGALKSNRTLNDKIQERKTISYKPDLAIIDKEIKDLRDMVNPVWSTSGLSYTGFRNSFKPVYLIAKWIFHAMSLKPFWSINQLVQRFNGGIGECRAKGDPQLWNMGACALNRYEHPEVRNKLEDTLVQQIFDWKTSDNGKTQVDLVILFGMSMSIIQIVDKLKQKLPESFTQLNLILIVREKEFLPWKYTACKDENAMRSISEMGYSIVLHEYYINQIKEYLLMAQNLGRVGEWNVTLQFVLQGHEESVLKSNSVIVAIDPGLEGFEQVFGRNEMMKLLQFTDPQTPFLYCDSAMVNYSLQLLTGYRGPFMAVQKLGDEQYRSEWKTDNDAEQEDISDISQEDISDKKDV